MTSQHSLISNEVFVFMNTWFSFFFFRYSIQCAIWFRWHIFYCLFWDFTNSLIYLLVWFWRRQFVPRILSGLFCANNNFYKMCILTQNRTLLVRNLMIRNVAVKFWQWWLPLFKFWYTPPKCANTLVYTAMIRRIKVPHVSIFLTEANQLVSVLSTHFLLETIL